MLTSLPCNAQGKSPPTYLQIGSFLRSNLTTILLYYPARSPENSRQWTLGGLSQKTLGHIFKVIHSFVIWSYFSDLDKIRFIFNLNIKKKLFQELN